jgi:inner membrane protein
MVEVLRRLRVHPVQYLLVGCALSVFFLLLLSLSEHLAFGISYAVAATACVSLLAFYATHVLGGWRPGLLFGTGIAGLYGALYLLLQMEQTAMVLGSVLLFLVLAAVMVLTRRVDWYGLIRSTAPTA